MRFNITPKLIIILSITCLGVIVPSSYFSYTASKEKLEEKLGLSLLHIAKTAVIGLKENQHRQIRSPKDEKKPEFKAIRDFLSQVREANSLDRECIYTFQVGKSIDKFKFAVMLSTPTFIGNDYEVPDYNQKFFKKVISGEAVYTSLYKDAHGQWISALAPITNTEGKVSGILEVDYKANKYLGEINVELRNTLLQTLPILFLGLIAMVVVSLYISSPIKKITSAVKKVSEGNYDIRLGDFTNDELGDLKKQFNQMGVQLQEKERALKNFLTLTNQGFFSFGSSMEIEVGYSQECHKILVQDNLEKKNPAEVLFEPGIKRDDFSESFRLYFQGKIAANALVRLLDEKIMIQKTSDDFKEIRVEYQEIEDNRFMCILTDESDKKELSTKLLSEREVQDHLAKVVMNGKYFGYLLNEAKELFSSLQKITSADKAEASGVEFFKSIMLDVHDLKANLSFFGFDRTIEFVFELESFLKDHIASEKALDLEQFKILSENNYSIKIQSYFDLERFKVLSENIQKSFAKELTFFKEKLGTEWMQNFNSLSIPKSAIMKVTGIIQERHPNDNYLLQTVMNLGKVPAKQIFHRFNDVSEKAAKQLGKKLRPISMEGGEIGLPVDTFEPLTKKLVHIIRNMVDHGIEPPEERLLKKKDEYGNIQIKIEKKKSNGKAHYLIGFSDDGRGIDFEKIKQIIHDKGLLSKSASASKPQLLKFLFLHNISTASEVSDISGRGVGLASVKAEIKRLKGEISIQTEKDQGTSFLIKIPTN